MAAIEAARQLIQSLGVSVPAKLETKYQKATGFYQSLKALRPTNLEYFKVLKRVKFDKVLRTFVKAAAKAQKKYGG